MNVAKNVLFYSLLSVAIIFSGCKQYDDDSFITLKTVKGRVMDKNWSLANLTIDGKDSTARYNSKGFTLACTESSSSSSSSLFSSSTSYYTYKLSYTYAGALVTTTGDFSFPNHGDNFQFDEYNYNNNNFSSSYGYYSSFVFDLNTDDNDSNPLWKIKKLDSHDFWMETTIKDVNNKLVLVQLKLSSN